MHSFITRVCQNTEHAKLHCTKIVTTKNWKNDAVVTFSRYLGEGSSERNEILQVARGRIDVSHHPDG